MKIKSIGKAAGFLRKAAAAALRGKAGALRARLLFLASPRRRAAVLARTSRHIRALAPGRCGRRQETAPSGRAAVLSRPPDHGKRATAALAGTRDDDGVATIGMAELARLFQEVDEDGDGGRYQDRTLALRSPFDDEEEPRHDIGELEDDEPSVIDLIRNRREGEGREFRIQDEIDHAADMFITRVRRRRMAAQPVLL
jgi:hypothetical protein